jgi:transcription elongation factor GreB
MVPIGLEGGIALERCTRICEGAGLHYISGMSRAFVRESDVPQLPDLPPQVSPLPPGAKNYLTAIGAERLRAELDRLLATERPRLASAPTDDIDAKRELQILDQRIRYLQESLRTAEVSATQPGPTDVVRFGTTVTVREKGTETRYRIVGVDETDLDRNWVSWLSPIARALLNARVGNRIQFKAPRGAGELEIVGIEYE